MPSVAHEPLKKVSIKNVRTHSTPEVPVTYSKGSDSEPKIVFNLEALVHIAYIFEAIDEMIKAHTLAPIFNKCTEWWDETAKLRESVGPFYTPPVVTTV